jgi:hypothetical protein
VHISPIFQIFFCQKYGINSLKFKHFFKSLFIKIHILIPSKIPSSHLFSSDEVIGFFFLIETPIFFLDSDSPFNCLNDSIKILLSYIRKFLRKKKINLEKINFITNKNKSKNQIDKSNSQIVLPMSIVCVICFTKRFRKWLI